MLSVASCIYSYSGDEYLTCTVKEEISQIDGQMKFMVGTFDDESSFVCIQTLDDVLLVIKTQAP